MSLFISLPHSPLSDDCRLGEATAVLQSWMERGEVDRRNANQFYSLIQSANGHLRRLMAEKAQQDEELENAKRVFQSALTAIMTQCKEASLCLCARKIAAQVGVPFSRLGKAPTLRVMTTTYSSLVILIV